MKFGVERVSPSKRQCSPHSMEGKTYFSKKVKSLKTYVHYNNAIYMGGMVSFKRNGGGVLLQDDGTSAIIDSNYDSLTEHSVFFRDNAIASLLHIRKGNFEIALRTKHFIFRLPFSDVDDRGDQPNGNGVLIDFRENKLYHLVYQRGVIVKKIV